MMDNVANSGNLSMLMRTDDEVGLWDGSETDAFDGSKSVAGLSADEAGGSIVDALGDLAGLASSSSESRENLAFALDGLTVKEREAAGGTEAMDAVLDEALLFSSDMVGSQFVMPEIIIAENGDIENAPDDAEFMLPEGVYGAFVPPTDETGGGTIYLSADLTNESLGDIPTLEDVALEEVGEAFADFAATQGVELADGDIGNRIVKVFYGEELTTTDFQDSVTDEIVLMMNRERIAAEASLMLPVPEPDTPYEFALFSSYLGKPGEALTSADYTTLANE